MTSYMLPNERQSPMNVQKILVRAAVTFVQVAISVLIGKGVLDVSADVAQVAVMSGAGAALSVIYNAATQWLATSEGGAPPYGD